MHRHAAIALVVLSSLMLGEAPCCRVHGYAGVALELAPDSEARGPGEFVCPCCDKPNPRHAKPGQGGPVRSFKRGCGATPLDGAVAEDETGIGNVELAQALPVPASVLQALPTGRLIAVCARTTDVPRPGALTLPLLL